jgi:hypothetical protein
MKNLLAATSVCALLLAGAAFAQTPNSAGPESQTTGATPPNVSVDTANHTRPNENATGTGKNDAPGMVPGSGTSTPPSSSPYQSTGNAPAAGEKPVGGAAEGSQSH